jgi:subtilisin
MPSGPDSASLSDVPGTFWAYKHVEHCVGQGVVKGYDDGYYHPDLPVTGDQMAVYIASAFGLL